MANQRMGWIARAWIVGVFGYSVLRALVVWPTLGTYGVSPWIFLAIDVVTAWPYAYGQVRVVKAFRSHEWGQTQVWSIVTLACFLAPYAYIVGAGSQEMPVLAYVIIGLLMFLFGAASVVRLLKQVRSPAPGPV